MSHITYIPSDPEEDRRILEDIRAGKGLPPIRSNRPGEEKLSPLPEPAVHYDRPDSLYPDTIRLSFPDGKTVVYDRRIKQPGPRRYLNMPRHQKKGGR